MYYLPGTHLVTFHILSHLILATTLLGRFYYLLFRDEETEAPRVKILSYRNMASKCKLGSIWFHSLNSIYLQWLFHWYIITLLQACDLKFIRFFMYINIFRFHALPQTEKCNMEMMHWPWNMFFKSETN